MTDRISFQEYQRLPGVNWTLLKEMRRSPGRYRWALDHPRPDTDAFRLGRATHTAVLEPERFLAEYVLWSGGRRFGREWEAFENAAAKRGVTVLTEEQYARCLAMSAAVRNDPVARPYLEQGEAERTLQWVDAATGIACKCRLDWLPPPAVVDLKTTRDIESHSFANDVARYGYHCKMAHYCAGLKATTGEKKPAVLIAVEKDPPFEVGVFRLSEHALCEGAQEVADLLGLLKYCQEKNEWNFSYTEEQIIDLPEWYLRSRDADGLDALAAEGERMMSEDARVSWPD